MKVAEDVLPARVYFFGILVLPRVYVLAVLVDFSLSEGMLFGSFGQRNLKPL